MSYTKVYEIVKNLTDKRLASATYYDDYLGCACVLGAVMPSLTKLRPSLQGAKLEQLEESDINYDAFEKLEVTPEELQELQDINDSDPDDWNPQTAAERYTRVLSWLQGKVEYVP